MKKALGIFVASVAVTVCATVFACGGGSPVTMTVSSDTDYENPAAPVSFGTTGDAGKCEDVM